MELSDNDILKTLSVNTLSHFWTIRACLPDMLKQKKGHIVCIASSAGLIGSAHLTDYCASKFGVVGLMESLRMELCPNINTTIVCPGHMNTKLFQGYKLPFPFNVLSPLLNTVDLAEQIIDAIEQKSTMLVIPKVINVSNAIKGMVPTWISDRLNKPGNAAIQHVRSSL